MERISAPGSQKQGTMSIDTVDELMSLRPDPGGAAISHASGS